MKTTIIFFKIVLHLFWIDKELRDRRLPHARKRLKIAKKQFREAKVEAKEERKESRKEKKNQSKFLYGQESKHKSNFFFQGKSLEELKAKKEVKAAKENLKSTKQAYKSKKVSRKAKTFLYVLGREGGELASENEDLEGYRTLQETLEKGNATVGFLITLEKLVSKQDKQQVVLPRKGWPTQKSDTIILRMEKDGN